MPKHKQKHRHAWCPSSEVLDELEALEAIYSDDAGSFQRGPGPNEVSIRVVPHEAALEANYVHADLRLTFPRDYPDEPMQLKLVACESIAVTQSKQIARSLHHAASEFAATGSVCAFQLIQILQEALQEINDEPVVEQEPSSLWEDMQRREIEALASRLSLENSVAENQGFKFVRGDLFDEDSFRDIGVEMERPRPTRRPSQRDGEQQTRRSPRQKSKLSSTSSARLASNPSATIQGIGGVDEANAVGDPDGGKEALDNDHSTILTEMDGSTLISSTESDSSRSFGSFMSRSFRQNLPDMVRTLLERTRSGSRSYGGGGLSNLHASAMGLNRSTIVRSGDSQASSLSGAGGGGQQQQSLTEIQRDLLIAKALFDRRDEASYHEDVLRAVEIGLIPSWLESLLLRHQRMFMSAFQKVFSRHIAILDVDASSSGEMSKYFSLLPPIKGVAICGDLDGNAGENAFAGSSMGRLTPALVSSLSRYNEDFSEVKVLGRGGYGKVFLAVHKFDGRSYAVKRVDLQSSGEEFEKIMREVQTLSRMQHQHVVRYYNAWLESSYEDDEGSSMGDELSYSDGDVTEATITPSCPPGGGHSEKFGGQCLYIQMEYCHTTLRKILDDGELADDDSRWKIVRQLLSGLAYVHQKGIIHRDLKPANIMLDTLGDVKLGDFGLAKELAAGREKEEPLDAINEREEHHRSRELGTAGTTGVCGTGFYIAPEIELASKFYDEKVDIFSLGIVVFELWNPFDTEMERFVTLKELREKSKLPDNFLKDHPDVGQFIGWLLNANPAARPTALEALRSELVPATIADDQLEDLLRSLPDNPMARDKMISELFKMHSNTSASAVAEGVALADMPGAPDAVANAQLERILRITETLRVAFKTSGAIEMTSKTMGPSRPESSASSMAFMASDGNFMSLRHEVRSRFVDWAVAAVLDGEIDNLHEGFKRFEVSKIYRNSRSPTTPKAYTMVDVDSLLPPKTATSVPLGEAELVSVICDAVRNIDDMDDERWELRISHSALFSALISERFGLPKELQQSVYKYLRQAAISVSPSDAPARQTKWTSMKGELISLGVSRESLTKIKEVFVQCAGDFASVQHKLLVLVPPKKKSGSSTSAPSSSRSATTHPWLDELNSMMSFLNSFGVPSSRCLLDPFVSPQEYYSGVLFELHCVAEDGSSTMFAAGGRYDLLVKAAWARQSVAFAKPSSEPTFGGFGVTINLDRLINASMNGGGAGTDTSPFRLSSAEVLVCSKGSGSGASGASKKVTDRTLLRIHEKAKIVRLLRDAGISGEMMPCAAPSMTDQFAYASSRSIPYLVVFDVDDLQMNSTVKIKQVHGKFEEECSLDELVRVLTTKVLPTNATHPTHPRHVSGAIQMVHSHSSEDLSDILANGGMLGVTASPMMTEAKQSQRGSGVRNRRN
jgi:serine/threonine protein kinase